LWEKCQARGREKKSGRKRKGVSNTKIIRSIVPSKEAENKILEEGSRRWVAPLSYCLNPQKGEESNQHRNRVGLRRIGETGGKTTSKESVARKRDEMKEAADGSKHLCPIVLI